jgi:dTDP-4-dehydrorhamnose reductase
MKVLIFGATGLIGEHVGRWFVRRGCRTVRVGRQAGGVDHAIDACDARRVDDVVRRESPDVVLNAVKGRFSTDASEERKAETWDVNVVCAENIAKAAAAAGAVLVHVSTAWVYEGREGEIYRETSATYPLNFYAHTKAIADERVLRYRPDALIVRTDSVFGPDRAGLNLFSRIRAAAELGGNAPAAVDQRSHPIYAGELARLLDALLCAGRRGIYHVVGPSYLSRYDLALRICQTFGYDPGIVRGGVSSTRTIRIPLYLQLDVSKLAGTAGPKSLDDQVADLKQEIDPR